MKKFLSLFLVTAIFISVFYLSGCDTEPEIIEADPVQLIDLSDTCITAQESGDYTYHPTEETIEIDTEDGEIFFNNLITVFVDGSLSSDEVQELLDHVDGELVGITRNGVNSLEIKVAESSLAELKAKADSLYDFDCVLFSDYDFPIAVSDADISNDPWTAGDTPIDDRGNEKYPDGNDWWAEAVGAYTAWELCENISEKTKVAIIDNGVNFDHEELSSVSNFSSYPNTPASHGTAVAGIIAAECNNNVGIRGIASENSEVEFFDTIVEGKEYFSSNEWVSIYSSLIKAGNKVVNLSMTDGTVYTKEYFDDHFYEDVIQNGKETDNWYDGILTKAFQASVGGWLYDDYMKFVTARAEKSSKLALNLIANLIYNGFEDFIFVQCAGNGYDGSTGSPGCYDFYSGVFAGICKEIFYDLPQTTQKKLGDKNIDYDSIVAHKIIVAATGKPDINGNYTITSWSSYGDNVDICAPGVDIYHCPSYGSPSHEDDRCCDYQDDISCCIKFAGTSAAAPIVSAGVALTWAAFPSASAATIKDIIINNATIYAPGSTEGDNRTYPMLNIGKSVEAALPEHVVLNPSDDEETKTEVDSGENSVYSDIISVYKVAAENNFFNGDQTACGDINFELWSSAYSGSELAYSLVDLCNDGEPELIIAALNSKYSGGYQIYDIWGQKNGTPYRIFNIGSMGYRTIYSVTDNNCLMTTYSYSEMWDYGEPGSEYPVQICYNEIYSLIPNSPDVVFAEGFKREIIGGEEFYCYYVDENENEINPFMEDSDYTYFQNQTGVAHNQFNYNPGRDFEWITICNNIKSN